MSSSSPANKYAAKAVGNRSFWSHEDIFGPKHTTFGVVGRSVKGSNRGILFIAYFMVGCGCDDSDGVKCVYLGARWWPLLLCLGGGESLVCGLSDKVH